MAASTRRGFVLAMLLAVYVFNFLDRQILAILAEPIKADLHLDNTQLGLLGGLAFAILYSTLAIPLALLADATRRTWVIAGSLAVWSAFTALCGTAGGFAALFACRLGVGVGEAGGVAPSYALIGAITPPGGRARALALYSLGIPLGAALGVLFGGYVAALVNWRAAFLGIGAIGLLFAPIFAATVREPARRPTPEARAGALATFRLLAAKRSFWLLSLGAASSSMLGYGYGFWLPSLLRRSFGLDLTGAARFYGALLLIGGVAGVLGGGWLGDRLGARDRAFHAWAPALAFLLAVPLFAAGLLSRTPALAFFAFLVPQALAYVWLGPVLTAAQHLVAAPMRATASACFLLVNNLIGVGFGAPAIGLLADRLTPSLSDDALRWAMLAGLVFYALAALLMALAGRPLRRDWVE